MTNFVIFGHLNRFTYLLTYGVINLGTTLLESM